MLSVRILEPLRLNVEILSEEGLEFSKKEVSHRVHDLIGCFLAVKQRKDNQSIEVQVVMAKKSETTESTNE